MKCPRKCKNRLKNSLSFVLDTSVVEILISVDMLTLDQMVYFYKETAWIQELVNLTGHQSNTLQV